MKNKLKITELESLTKNQLKAVNGGWIGIAIAIGLYLLSEFDSIKQGVNDSLADKSYDYN